MNGQAMYADVARQGEGQDFANHAQLVKRIAFRLHSRLPPSVQVEDLIQAGMIGLLEAISNYDASQGASFETYAGIRIRGSMLDEIRIGDWTPRAVRRQSRALAAAVKAVEDRKGGEATAAEVAEEMGVELTEYHRMLTNSVTSKIFSLDDDGPFSDYGDSIAGDEGLGPQTLCTGQAFRNAVVQAIESLPDRERLVMALYYDEELTLKEVGAVLDLSESRVCQIHAQALVRLRARLTDWVED